MSGSGLGLVGLTVAICGLIFAVGGLTYTVKKGFEELVKAIKSQNRNEAGVVEGPDEG